jgi:hypothetical protein
MGDALAGQGRARVCNVKGRQSLCRVMDALLSEARESFLCIQPCLKGDGMVLGVLGGSYAVHGEKDLSALEDAVIERAQIRFTEAKQLVDDYTSAVASDIRSSD